MNFRTVPVNTAAYISFTRDFKDRYTFLSWLAVKCKVLTSALVCFEKTARDL